MAALTVYSFEYNKNEAETLSISENSLVIWTNLLFANFLDTCFRYFFKKTRKIYLVIWILHCIFAVKKKTTQVLQYFIWHLKVLSRRFCSTITTIIVVTRKMITLVIYTNYYCGYLKLGDYRRIMTPDSLKRKENIPLNRKSTVYILFKSIFSLECKV